MNLANLFTQVWAMQSPEADKVCEQMAAQAREAANDEYSEFDWEVFQTIVDKGNRVMKELGCRVAFEHLASLYPAAANGR